MDMNSATGLRLEDIHWSLIVNFKACGIVKYFMLDTKTVNY